MPPIEPAQGGGFPAALLALVATLIASSSTIALALWRRRVELEDKARLEARAAQEKAEAEATAAQARRRVRRARRAREEREERDRRLEALERKTEEHSLADVRHDSDIRGFGTLLADLGAAIRELRAAILNRSSVPGGE